MSAKKEVHYENDRHSQVMANGPNSCGTHTWPVVLVGQYPDHLAQACQGYIQFAALLLLFGWAAHSLCHAHDLSNLVPVRIFQVIVV